MPRAACLLAILWVVASAAAATAATVKVAWDPNPETSLAGYKIYYGTTKGPPPTGTIVATEGASPITVPLSALADPKAPTFTLTGVPSCAHLFLVATAYDTAGQESGFSAGVEATVVDKPSPVTVAAGSNPGTLVTSWGGLASGDTGTLSSYRLHYDLDAGEPYQGTGATQGASPVTVPTSAKTYQLTGLTAGTTIHVAVEALCADGSGKLSEDATGVVPGGHVCGNGVVEVGELCDPPSSCPTSCNDGNACTSDVLTGSAASCDAVCSHTTITTCKAGDGCCPPGCTSSTDSDCSVSCGNGTLEAGETCDPPSSCPASCDDQNSCTSDKLTGSPSSCSVACSHTTVTACQGGDGCCPAGCVKASDSDCAKEPAAEDPATLAGGCALGPWPSRGAPSALMLLVGLGLLLRRRGR